MVKVRYIKLLMGIINEICSQQNKITNQSLINKDDIIEWIKESKNGK